MFRMERWEWLGEPLALDFANTVRRRGLEYVEHLRDEGDLAEWARREGIELGPIMLDEVRELRDAVFAILLAATRGERPPPESERRVNDVLATLVPQLRDGELVLAGSTLLPRVATSLLEHVRDPALAFCDAPSCGQFFIRHRRDQRWCGPACGTRARVARHAARGHGSA
jgi:predicted RNA-binding Zn ribbon-like protein